MAVWPTEEKNRRNTKDNMKKKDAGLAGRPAKEQSKRKAKKNSAKKKKAGLAGQPAKEKNERKTAETKKKQEKCWEFVEILETKEKHKKKQRNIRKMTSNLFAP